MAEKPSNSRKKVSFQPARDGHGARWEIEGATASSKPERAPRNQRERAQARIEEHKRKAGAGTRAAKAERDAATRVRKQRELVEVNERAVRDRSAAAVRRSKDAHPAERRAAAKPAVAKPAVAKGSPSRTETDRRPRTADDHGGVRPMKGVGRGRAQERVRAAAKPERIVAENPQRARHASSERTRSNVMEAMLPSSKGSASHSTVFGLSMRTVIIVVLLVVVVVFFLWHPWSRGTEALAPDPGEQAPPSDILEERFSTMPTYGIVAPVDFNAVEEEGFTAGFVLAHGGVVTDYSVYDTEPELSDASAQVLNEALEPFTENDAITAFLLMDIQTGRGFARNVDKTIYGASSFKGPYCAYLLKKYVDGGDTKLNDTFASGYMTANLGYARSGTDSLDNLIEETIVDSSNDAFASLRVSFSDKTLSEWLTSIDVDDNVAYDTWFPFNTVRNMAKLWMETYYYLQTNSEAARALGDYMGSTTKSFMRESLTGVRALEEPAEDGGTGQEAVTAAASEGGQEAATAAADESGQEAVTEAADDQDVSEDEATLEESSTLKVTGSVGKNLGNMVEHSIDVIMAPEITVRDKAGWNIDADENYNALVDCGIVTCNGRDYLLCVMADAAFTDSNVEDFERLIAAVFEARQDLA